MLSNTAVQKKEITLLEKVILFFLSFIPLLSINTYIFDNEAVLYKNSILNIFLYIMIALLIFKSYKISDNLLSKKSSGAALLLSIVLVCGNSVYKTNTLRLVFGSFNAFINSLAIFIGFFILIYFAIKLGLYYISRLKIQSPLVNEWKLFGASWQSLLFIWGLIFLCWLPCYLAYFPGTYSYDIVGQTFQALGFNPFDRFQTTAHTFFFKICIDIGRLFGGAKAGLITYSILQMLILSFSFSFAILYMAKIKIHYGLRLLAFIYFAFNPLNAIFSFVTTKDVLFTAFFVIATIMLIDVVKNTDRFFNSLFRRIALCAVMVLCCLFRHNAFLAFVLFFISFMLIYREHLKIALQTFIIFVLSFSLIMGPIYTLLGVEGGNVKEVLSVPMQQIANVAKNHAGSLKTNEREAIAEIINYEEAIKVYNPRYADPVKDDFNTPKFCENPFKYIKLWLSLFIQYPGEYIDSLLSLNLGYWYPDSVHPDEYSNRIYIETYVRDVNEFKVQRESFFPKLLEQYEKFASGTAMQELPIISLFFSIGFPVWFILSCILILSVKKKGKLKLIFMPALFMWLTFILGPVSNLRYIYYAIACYPIYMAIVLQPELVHEDKSYKEQNDENLNTQNNI